MYIAWIPQCGNQTEGGEDIHVQSDLGYPATSGPAHIRISDLAGYERYA